MAANSDSPPTHTIKPINPPPPSPFRFTLARFHEALGQSIRGGETAMDAHKV